MGFFSLIDFAFSVSIFVFRSRSFRLGDFGFDLRLLILSCRLPFIDLVLRPGAFRSSDFPFFGFDFCFFYETLAPSDFN